MADIYQSITFKQTIPFYVSLQSGMVANIKDDLMKQVFKSFSSMSSNEFQLTLGQINFIEQEEPDEVFFSRCPGGNKREKEWWITATANVYAMPK